jgi:hypothetical protein
LSRGLRAVVLAERHGSGGDVKDVGEVVCSAYGKDSWW